MWCSQGERPVCVRAMGSGGKNERRWPSCSGNRPIGAASVCGAKMGRQLSNLEVPGCDLRPPGARTYCFKAR